MAATDSEGLDKCEWSWPDQDPLKKFADQQRKHADKKRELLDEERKLLDEQPNHSVPGDNNK